MADADEGWRQHAKKAGDAVIARREKLGYKTRAQFAEDVDLHVKTLGEIERGVRRSYDRSTYATIDRVLRWPAGSFEGLLVGDPKVPDMGAELMSATGLLANLFVSRLDLTELIHESGLGPDDRFALVKKIRLAQDVFDRQLFADIADEIKRRGGTVDNT